MDKDVIYQEKRKEIKQILNDEFSISYGGMLDNVSMYAIINSEPKVMANILNSMESICRDRVSFLLREMAKKEEERYI